MFYFEFINLYKKNNIVKGLSIENKAIKNELLKIGTSNSSGRSKCNWKEFLCLETAVVIDIVRI